MSRGFTLCVLSCLVAVPVLAEQWEIVPFGGTRIGGNVTLSNSPYTNLAINNGAAYGLSVGYRVSPIGEVDGTWSRQSTSVAVSGPGVAEVSVSHVGIDQFRLDGLYLAGHGALRPFVLVGLGATYFEPVDQFSGATRFTGAFGLGLKYYVSRTWGLRFDARWVPTVLSSDDSLYCQSGASGLHCEAVSTGGNSISQFEFVTGVILRFGPAVGEPTHDEFGDVKTEPN